MADWRYLAQRITGNDDNTGTFISTELPLREVSITPDVLSGPTGMSAVIDPSYAGLIAPDGRPLLDEWGTAIWAEADGQLRGGGILVRSAFEDGQWRIETMGYAGYPQQQPFTDSKLFVQWDPLSIVRYIWLWLQARPNSNLHVAVDTTRSPVRIGTKLTQAEFDTQAGPVSFEAGPYRLAWYETADLGQAIDELASSTPFDYREIHSWNDDKSAIKHRIQLGWPQLGRRRHDLRFVVGENVMTIPGLTRDGDKYANEILVLGRGEGRQKIRATQYVPDGRLRRTRLYSDENVAEPNKAGYVARQQLRLRKGQLTTSEITLRDHANARIGSWSAGDEILVQVDTRDISDAFWARVLSTTIQPEAAEYATIAIQRADVIDE